MNAAIVFDLAVLKEAFKDKNFGKVVLEACLKACKNQEEEEIALHGERIGTVVVADDKNATYIVAVGNGTGQVIDNSIPIPVDENFYDNYVNYVGGRIERELLR